MVMFPHLLDLRHLKHAEPAKDVQKYEGRVVLHWNNVQDDNGYKAVFVGHKASVSLMAAARFLDKISRPRMASQDCEDCLSKNAHKYGHDSHPVEDRKVRIQIEEPVVFSRAKPVRSSLGRTVFGKDGWKKYFESTNWKTIPTWECFYVHRPSQLFLSAYVAERKTWDRREDIDLEEPTCA